MSGKYSNTLSSTIKKMLQVSPPKRVTSFELLEMPELEDNIGKTVAKLSTKNTGDALLETIAMPKKLGELAHRLPRAKYTRRTLKRMNSEPCRLPVINDTRESINSVVHKSSKWELNSKKSNGSGFEPRSAIITKKKASDIYANRGTGPSRYYSKENIDRSALYEAGQRIASRSRKARYVVDFSRRNSESRQYSEERKEVISRHVSEERKSFGRPANKPPVPGFGGLAKPPLGNVNLNIPQPKIVRPYEESPRNSKFAFSPSQMGKLFFKFTSLTSL